MKTIIAVLVCTAFAVSASAQKMFVMHCEADLGAHVAVVTVPSTSLLERPDPKSESVMSLEKASLLKVESYTSNKGVYYEVLELKSKQAGWIMKDSVAVYASLGQNRLCGEAAKSSSAGFGPGPIPWKNPAKVLTSGALEPGPSGPRLPSRKLRILSKPRPGYTKAAKEADIVGRVRLRVEFRSDGTIGKITPVYRLSHGLTEKAIYAARGIKFSPEIVNGKPVSVKKIIDFSFALYD